MAFNLLPIYPASGAYVVRLHRDSPSGAAHLLGRVEHLESGEFAVFTDSAELLTWLSKRGEDKGATERPSGLAEE